MNMPSQLWRPGRFLCCSCLNCRLNVRQLKSWPGGAGASNQRASNLELSHHVFVRCETELAVRNAGFRPQLEWHHGVACVWHQDGKVAECQAVATS